MHSSLRSLSGKKRLLPDQDTALLLLLDVLGCIRIREPSSRRQGVPWVLPPSLTKRALKRLCIRQQPWRLLLLPSGRGHQTTFRAAVQCILQSLQMQQRERGHSGRSAHHQALRQLQLQLQLQAVRQGQELLQTKTRKTSGRCCPAIHGKRSDESALLQPLPLRLRRTPPRQPQKLAQLRQPGGMSVMGGPSGLLVLRVQQAWQAEAEAKAAADPRERAWATAGQRLVGRASLPACLKRREQRQLQQGMLSLRRQKCLEALQLVAAEAAQHARNR